MKRILLLLAMSALASASAQNISDNKVSFTYIQLPSSPIDNQYTTYDIVLDRGFEMANEDSLSSYALRVDAAVNQYDSEMTVWKESKRTIDRAHLSAMASWEKQVFAGSTSTVQPIKANYPA